MVIKQIAQSKIQRCYKRVQCSLLGAYFKCWA